jgi:3-methyladenine DNA glycosylase AlkD
LAQALWLTGWYEARMLACLIDDPALVTPKQMDRWRADFDNWAIVDTVCFKLFDRVPGAFAKVEQWATLNEEFGRRAAFALLASLALHGHGEDADFRRGLALIEAAATDERNFVKKGVNWSLRAIGSKRSPALRAAARKLAERLAAQADKTARWIGKDALRAFAKADKSKA